MEDKDTGVQFLYHFGRFKNRVLGEYIYLTAVTLHLGIWSLISREGKRDGNCQSVAVHSDSYSGVRRTAVWRSLSPVTTGCLQQSAYTRFLTFR